ncbi:MAG: bacillithiol system redox-active protein YtxJ [Chitinophagia bacterium]|jgi:bacillithiol system protein YtxJ
MNWQPINNVDQLEKIKAASFNTPQVIFKHSTTCSISRMALDRFERATTPEKVDFHYLDLLNYRTISSEIATFFQVHHESPQVLLIKNGECIYDESHYGIMMDELISFL